MPLRVVLTKIILTSIMLLYVDDFRDDANLADAFRHLLKYIAAEALNDSVFKIIEKL